jgi:hypothetical protein
MSAICLLISSNLSAAITAADLGRFRVTGFNVCDLDEEPIKEEVLEETLLILVNFDETLGDLEDTLGVNLSGAITLS